MSKLIVFSFIMYIILVTALTYKVNLADMMYIVKFKYIGLAI